VEKGKKVDEWKQGPGFSLLMVLVLVSRVAHKTDVSARLATARCHCCSGFQLLACNRQLQLLPTRPAAVV
jgi:hypothetical protein